MTYLEKKGCDLFCKMYEEYQVRFVNAMQAVVDEQEEEEKRKKKASAKVKKSAEQAEKAPQLRLVK